MNPAQISAVVFLSCLAAAFFHFSGYVAAKGFAKNGNWTALGAVPLIMVTIAGAVSFVAFVFHTLTSFP